LALLAGDHHQNERHSVRDSHCTKIQQHLFGTFGEHASQTDTEIANLIFPSTVGGGVKTLMLFSIWSCCQDDHLYGKPEDVWDFDD